MIRIGALLIAALVLASVPPGWSASAYPPISYLAGELNLAVGQPLPKGVIWNGRPFSFYIVGARQLPNGEYDVRLRAR